ncbi:MAG: peptide-methionine (S)-S-oxide reductase MsrA [Nitriliruptoraceae bacterium]
MARHAVLDQPLVPPWPEDHALAMFGMGCFWGAERVFWSIPGVWTTFAAYAGGHTVEPNYGDVCTSRTGHAEVVGIVYDPAVVGYEELLRHFWEQHDPTQGMRQGNDVGSQYRSIILTTTSSQWKIAHTSRTRYQQVLTEEGFGGITTEIVRLERWYLAETDHQQYLAKHPSGYCNHGFCQAPYFRLAEARDPARGRP